MVLYMGKSSIALALKKVYDYGGLVSTAGVQCLCGGCKTVVLHYCVVIFFGPHGSRSVHVCCLHLKMEFRSCARGVSHSLLQMNSFNKTEAAVFSCRLCFLSAFSFISLILLSMVNYKFATTVAFGLNRINRRLLIVVSSDFYCHCYDQAL